MFLFRRRLLGLRNQPASPEWFVSVLYSIVASVGTFVAIWENGDRVADHLKTVLTVHPGFEEYDFIVVGAGSAGAVVANRLSANPAWKVLLVEAGGEPHPLQSIPVFAFTMLNYPEIDWMHKTVPQKKACFGLLGNSSGWSQGKSLGGTGNINFMLHYRGNPKDFDNWAKITEDESWTYEKLLPFFKKSEDFEGEWRDAKMHGVGGPLRIQKPDYVGIANAYVKAGEEMGYNKTDLNGYYTEGFDTSYYPIKNGKRQATYKSFIIPARRRPNLVIYKYAHVNKILIRENSKEAYGIQYDRHGERRTAYARKEIIISAGVVNSPKILMLSGIGPKAHLESKEIPVVMDLPVGQNLQDHLSTYLGPFEIQDHSRSLTTGNFDRDITPASFVEFGRHGTGILSTTGVQASGIFSSSLAKGRGEGDWPDLQLFLAGISVHRGLADSLSHAFHLKREVFNKYYSSSVGKNSFTQIVSLGRPKSRGEILLAKNDPYAEPLIDPKYLENEEDLQVLLEGVKKAVYLAENTTVFRNARTAFTTSVLPGCEDVPFRSDAYWECYIRTYSVTLHHSVGTCAMGKSDSPAAVVDSQFRVIGVNNLRVVDASVMPVVPVSNTQAPCIMLGEKGADLVIRTHIPRPEPTTTTTEIPNDNGTIVDNIIIVDSSSTTTEGTTTEENTIALKGVLKRVNSQFVRMKS